MVLCQRGEIMKSSCSERLSQALSIKNITQTELCKRTGIPKSAMSQYIKGSFEPKQDRIYLIAKALNISEAWLMGYDVSMHRENYSNKSGIKIPVLGLVRAGIPMDAVEYIIDYEEISEEMARQGEYFGLQIKGNSMEPRITEGDVVIVRKQPDVESGEIAIILINGDEATIKKVQKFNGGINLIPSNPAYDVMTYTNEQIEKLPIRILGKIVELRAKF